MKLGMIVLLMALTFTPQAKADGLQVLATVGGVVVGGFAGALLGGTLGSAAAGNCASDDGMCGLGEAMIGAGVGTIVGGTLGGYALNRLAKPKKPKVAINPYLVPSMNSMDVGATMRVTF